MQRQNPDSTLVIKLVNSTKLAKQAIAVNPKGNVEELDNSIAKPSLDNKEKNSKKGKSKRKTKYKIIKSTAGLSLNTSSPHNSFKQQV